MPLDILNFVPLDGTTIRLGDSLPFSGRVVGSPGGDMAGVPLENVQMAVNVGPLQECDVPSACLDRYDVIVPSDANGYFSGSVQINPDLSEPGRTMSTCTRYRACSRMESGYCQDRVLGGRARTMLSCPVRLRLPDRENPGLIETLSNRIRHDFCSQGWWMVGCMDGTPIVRPPRG